ncbi:MAG: exodeoxyribonuclease VII small subunit [Leptolyngbyaceae cyanobacterium bins.302]|nr:exodeoxyribonuclease VII small subunit [Leptolyngbyaceae cyanobacterium bins.302]
MMNLNQMTNRDDATPPPEPADEGWSYENTVQQIEATIARIESGELELADVFDEFGEAVKNLRQCEFFLAKRQRQMDLLIETLSDEPEF